MSKYIKLISGSHDWEGAIYLKIVKETTLWYQTKLVPNLGITKLKFQNYKDKYVNWPKDSNVLKHYSDNYRVVSLVDKTKLPEDSVIY